jgi:hypothetical protein
VKNRFQSLPFKRNLQRYSAVVTADLASIAAYVHAVASGEAERMTGRPLYDFFMGAALNPRVFGGRGTLLTIVHVRTLD